MTERIAYITTSDRSTFKKCRRLWDWSSPLRDGLRPLQKALPLWLGNAAHHAMEDYNGYRLYPTINDAIDDYVQACVAAYGKVFLPENYMDDITIIKDVLNYYVNEWLHCDLQVRDNLTTVVVDGVPQVEVDFEMALDIPNGLMQLIPYDKVIYKGTFDRVTIDDNGFIYINDYKFVSSFANLLTLELDAQISAYMLAGRLLYGDKLAGFVYHQFLKDVPSPPRILQNGTVSTDKRQRTNHAMYERTLIQTYGDDMMSWPADAVSFMNQLAEREEPNADAFIRRDIIYRDKANSAEIEGIIYKEVVDMLNPNVNIYPNPSFLCATITKCPFVEPCLQKDKSEKYSLTLSTEYEKEELFDRNKWRDYLKVKPTDVIQATSKPPKQKVSQPPKPKQSKPPLKPSKPSKPLPPVRGRR